MPLGPLTLRAESGTVGDALRRRLAMTPATGSADIEVTSSVPQQATHVIIDGPLTQALDAWDAAVPAQTVAGALWLVPGQPQAPDAALAWTILRTQTPATPLSDLTDNQGRALRWAVASATTVQFPHAKSVEVSSDDVTQWADAQPQVQHLGDATARVGGETAEAVLSSVEKFRAACTALVELGASTASTATLDASVAAHLREVQKSGFARWRGAKARAGTLSAVQQAAREYAGQRLQEVLDHRSDELAAQAMAAVESAADEQILESVGAALADLKLPVEPDFSVVPRSWSTQAPSPRRYVFVHEDLVSRFADLDVTVWPADLPADGAVCAVVQSGFSLPAILSTSDANDSGVTVSPSSGT